MDMDNVKMNEELKKLNEAEQAWNEKLNNEIKSEDEIISAIEDIAQNLYTYNKTRAVINEKKFIVGCKITTIPMPMEDPLTGEVKGIPVKTVILIVANEDKQKLLQHKYIPAIVRAEYDERYDTKANIRAAVEGWVRHVTGTVKAEMLE